eukprot:CAMPEP_0114486680 /NCGR_PEP_ID=MMETSP0109-20121206/346_1 /TAXON_ID=29199 /ORGANISM="Chlorarachnion reptans, Strain CCCM449" /LENGTH=525 /DNA_ID=CAMNT_0001662863 /DNA_START=56 /DNA_END=1631 /DNA_ORIENTATION=+
MAKDTIQGILNPSSQKKLGKGFPLRSDRISDQWGGGLFLEGSATTLWVDAVERYMLARVPVILPFSVSVKHHSIPHNKCICEFNTDCGGDNTLDASLYRWRRKSISGVEVCAGAIRINVQELSLCLTKRMIDIAKALKRIIVGFPKQPLPSALLGSRDPLTLNCTHSKHISLANATQLLPRASILEPRYSTAQYVIANQSGIDIEICAMDNLKGERRGNGSPASVLPDGAEYALRSVSGAPSPQLRVRLHKCDSRSDPVGDAESSNPWSKAWFAVDEVQPKSKSESASSRSNKPPNSSQNSEIDLAYKFVYKSYRESRGLRQSLSEQGGRSGKPTKTFDVWCSPLVVVDRFGNDTVLWICRSHLLHGFPKLKFTILASHMLKNTLPFPVSVKLQSHCTHTGNKLRTLHPTTVRASPTVDINDGKTTNTEATTVDDEWQTRRMCVWPNELVALPVWNQTQANDYGAVALCVRPVNEKTSVSDSLSQSISWPWATVTNQMNASPKYDDRTAKMLASMQQGKQQIKDP